MKLSNRAIMDVVAAHALYCLYASQLNERHKDKYRRLLNRKSMVDGTMSALRSRARRACLSIGISEDEITKATHEAWRKHFRIRRGPKSKKSIAETLGQMERAAMAMPLG